MAIHDLIRNANCGTITLGNANSVGDKISALWVEQGPFEVYLRGL